jgi:hypothetical protein
MKRFVGSEFWPAYALIAIGLLIEALIQTGSALGYVVASGLGAVGVGIVFRPQSFHPMRGVAPQSGSWRRPQ